MRACRNMLPALLFERMESIKFLYLVYLSNHYYLVWGFIELHQFPLFYLATRGPCLPHIMWKRTDSGISELKLIKILYIYKILLMLGLSVWFNLGIFPHHTEFNLENPFTFQPISYMPLVYNFYQRRADIAAAVDVWYENSFCFL